AGSDVGRSNRWFCSVAAFGYSLDRGEILLIVIAVAQEQQMFQPGAPFQVQRMAAKEFAGHANDPNPFVEQRDRKLWPHAFVVLALVKLNQVAEKRGDH